LIAGDQPGRPISKTNLTEKALRGQNRNEIFLTEAENKPKSAEFEIIIDKYVGTNTDGTSVLKQDGVGRLPDAAFERGNGASD